MHWNLAPDALPGSARLVRVLDCWRNDYIVCRCDEVYIGCQTPPIWALSSSKIIATSANHRETLLWQLSDLSLALYCKNVQAIITSNWL